MRTEVRAPDGGAVAQAHAWSTACTGRSRRQSAALADATEASATRGLVWIPLLEAGWRSEFWSSWLIQQQHQLQAQRRKVSAMEETASGDGRP